MHAFFTTSKLLIKQKIAFGRLLISCRDISSLVYHGLTVVTTKLASDDPSHAMTYSRTLKLKINYTLVMHFQVYFLYLVHLEDKWLQYRPFQASNWFSVEWPRQRNDLSALRKCICDP